MNSQPTSAPVSPEPRGKLSAWTIIVGIMSMASGLLSSYFGIMGHDKANGVALPITAILVVMLIMCTSNDRRPVNDSSTVNEPV